MKFENRFPNDTHELLKRVQYKYYYKMVGNLFNYSNERYISAARLLRLEQDYIHKLFNIYSFDHMLLEESHDIIAAYYRFKIDLHGQMPLPFDKKSYTEYLEIGWCRYFHGEAQGIANDDFLAWLIVHIVENGVVEKVKAEKEELEADLSRRYALIEETPYYLKGK